MVIKPEEVDFVNQARAFMSRVGPNAVLLLVGSRGAGLSDSWSDLDMWIVGDKTYLSPAERGEYEQRAELFVDRGDREAHWSFFDQQDLETLLQSYPDKKMWILSTAQLLGGNRATAEVLKTHCQAYPRDVAERRLKWHFGRYWQAMGPLNSAARGRPETAFLAAGIVIESLCKVCCLADRTPFPYTKWLVSVSRETVLGRRIFPFVSEAVHGITEFVHPPEGKHFRELIPLKKLRETKEIVRGSLKEIGWTCSWIDNPDDAVVGTWHRTAWD
jgi:hypothetical protein